MSNPPPTLVSTFEILFTPQLPPGLGPQAVATADELVVKGFFLTISNPNPAAYTFNVGFHCNVNPAPVPAQRTLASAVGFLDDGTTGNPLTISPAGTNGTDFSATVPVSANGTVLVGILPAFFTATGLAPATIECRGWVDVTLPALLRRVGGGKFGFFEFVAQSANPITALLVPEQRLTFLPMSGDASSAVEAQSAFALPPASGQSAVTVPPQPSRPLLLEPAAFDDEAPEVEMSAVGGMLSARPEQQAVMLAALLSGTPAVRGKERSVDQVLQTLGFHR